jgi:hypothetical protein
MASSEKKWQQTKKAAKADATLKALALAIRTANLARTPDRLAYAAFSDRCEEMGLFIPPGYLSIILSITLFNLGSN